MNPKISPSPDYYCQDSVPVPEMILYPFLVNAIEIVLRLWLPLWMRRTLLEGTTAYVAGPWILELSLLISHTEITSRYASLIIRIGNGVAYAL